MKRFFAAAVMMLLMFTAISLPAGEDSPSDRTIPELTLTERIEDLLEAVEDETPVVYRRMNEIPREEALARVMKALDSGVVPAAAAGKQQAARVVERDVRDYPVFGVTDRGFPYLRIDGVFPGTASRSVQELERLTVRTVPAGVIVDLREANAGSVSAVNTLAEAVRKLGCPVITLVSGKTSREGELTAAVLRRDCGAVLIGTETAGSIFPLKRIVVNDVPWFVPDPPEEYYDISPYALKPDLERSAESRLGFDELKEKPGSLDGDPLLRLAGDLLTLKAAVKPVEE